MYQDWNQFLMWLAVEYTAGRDLSELNANISNQQVHWYGTIAKVEIEGRIAPALTLRMSPAEVALADGWMLNGEHLSLPVRGDAELGKAAKAQAGQKVQFSAHIESRDAIFPPLNFIPDKAQHRVFVTLGVVDVQLLQFSP
jgi:hypothetical protein